MTAKPQASARDFAVTLYQTVRFIKSFIVVVACALITRAGAQALADRLPPSTLVYAGWSPSISLLGTRAAWMLADQRVARPWRILLQQTVLELPDELAGGGEKISTHFPLLLAEAAQCEGCFALLDVNKDKDNFAPQAVLLIKLGDHRKAFEQHFQPIHRRLKDRLGERVHMMKLADSWLWEKTSHDRAEYTWGFAGDWFVFYLGDKAETFLPTLSLKLDKSLKDSPAFTDCLGKIPGDSIFTTFVNLNGGLDIFRTLLKDSNDDGARLIVDRWPKILAQLGLDNAKSIGEKTTVEAGQFVTRSLVRTAGPPHGFLASLVQPAVDETLLKAVPADAMFALAMRADLAKAYDGLKESTVAVAGEDARKTFADLEDAAAGTGVPVKTMLAPIGDQWIVYEAASTGGFALTGLTFVVDVRDPKQLGRSLSTLQNFLSHQINNEDAAGTGQYDVDGNTIHYVEAKGFTLFTPAWAVVDGKLFVALYPQVVEDAVRQLKADQSLADNPAFVAARKQVGSGGPMLYVSGPEFARSLYPVVLPLVSAIREFNATFEDRTLPTAQLLPSLQRLLNYVGVDVVSVALTPDGVLRTKTVANPLLSPLTLTDSVPLWVALALPTLESSRANAERVKSGDHLRQIGQAISIYEVANNDKLPPDLATAIKGQDVPADVLKSPFGKGDGNYRYLVEPGMTKETPPDIAIAFDAAELTSGDGASVLYADGHVEWLDQEGVKTVLEKSAKWREERKRN